jgi:hypothetical protein
LQLLPPRLGLHLLSHATHKGLHPGIVIHRNLFKLITNPLLLRWEKKRWLDTPS